MPEQPEQPQQPSEVDLRLRAFAERFRAEQSGQIADTLTLASEKDPWLEAEVQSISKELGVSEDGVRSSLDAMRTAKRRRDIKLMDLQTNAPVLARALMDPKVAAIAHDQVANLGTLERLRLKFNNGMLINERGAIGERMRRGAATPEDDARLKQIEELQALVPHEQKSYFEPAAEVLGQMLDVVPQALATGVATGAAAAPLGLIAGPGGAGAAFGTGFKAGLTAGWSASTYTSESGNQYLDLIKAGYSHEIAAKATPAMGLFNASVDLLGVYAVSKPFVSLGNKLLGKAGGAVVGGVTRAAVRPTWARTLLKGAAAYAEAGVSETGVEVVQEVGNILSDRYARSLQAAAGLAPVGPEPTTQQNIDRLTEIAKTTAMAMSVLAFPGPAMQVAAAKREVDAAKRSVDAMRAIGELGKNEELRKRDPVAWAKLVRESGARVAATEVYLQQGKLREVLEQAQRIEAEKVAKERNVPVEQVLAEMPDVFRQLEDISAPTAKAARETLENDDVVIPIETYERIFAGTELGNALSQHMRFSPEASSLFEARARLEQVKAEFEQLAPQVEAKLESDEAFAASHQQVFDLYVDQLKRTGRYESDEQVQAMAVLVAGLFAARAVRDGTTPEQEYYRHPYNVVAGQSSPAKAAAQILHQKRDLRAMDAGAAAKLDSNATGGIEIAAQRGRSGQILFREDANGVTLLGAKVDPELSGLDYERQLTVEAARHAVAGGKSLASGDVAPEARPLWDDLVTRGVAEKVSDGYVVPAAKVGDIVAMNDARTRLKPAPVTTEAATSDPRATEGFLSQREDNADISLRERMVTGAKRVEADRLIDLEGVPKLKPQDLVGLKIFPTIADRTAAGRVYEVEGGGKTLEIPLLGGPLFMLRASNWAANVVWANRGEAVKGAKAKKVEFGSDYMMVALGSSDMHQSNSTVAMALLTMLAARVQSGAVPKANVPQIEAIVHKVAGEKSRELSEFKLDVSIDAMRKYVDSMSFEARKSMFTALSTAKAMSLGVPDTNLILDATREPSMAGHAIGQGVALVKIDRENPFVELGTNGTTLHPDFPIGVRGTVVGVMETPISWKTLWQDWLQAKIDGKFGTFDLAQTPAWKRTRTWAGRQKLVAKLLKAGEINENTARETLASIDEAWHGPKKDRQTPSEFDAWIGSDRLKYGSKMGLWRSFSMSMPVVEVTQNLVDRIGDISHDNVANWQTARTAADFALGNWRDQTKNANEGGVSFTKFADAAALVGVEVSDDFAARAAKKSGALKPRLFQLGDQRIFFALDQGYLTHAVNAEQGVRGVATPAILLKAIEEGAVGIRLPEKTTASEAAFWASVFAPFNFTQSATNPLEFSYDGTTQDRVSAKQRYLSTGIAGVLDERTAADVAAAENAFVDDARASGEAATSESVAEAQVGARSGAGASLASRAHAAIQAISNLSDGAADNLGIPRNERDVIRAAVDSGELARDGDVFRQLEDIEPDPRDLVVTHNLATNSLSKLLFDEGENAVLIAPSLAVVNTKVDMLDQFGEITLLGTPDQIDPAQGKAIVYDADAWTARFPTVSKEIDYDKVDKFVPYVEASLNRALNVDLDLEQEDLAAGKIERERRAEAVAASMNKWLSDVKDTPEHQAWLRITRKQRYIHEVRRGIGWWIAQMESFLEKDILKADNPLILAASGRLLSVLGPDFVQSVVDEADHWARSDDDDVSSAVRTWLAVRTEVTEAEAAAIKDSFTPKAVFYPDEGPQAGKKIPATVGNVLEYMLASAWKPGEDMRLGELGKGREKRDMRSFGQLRAALARRFRSIAEISAARNKIVAQDEHIDEDFTDHYEESIASIQETAFDAVKAASGASGVVLTGPFLTEGKKHATVATSVGDLIALAVDREITVDDVMASLIRNGAVLKDSAALREATAQSLPVWKQLVASALALEADYFEAKATRAVPIAEFRAAVLPDELRDSPLANNLGRTRVIRYYEAGSAASRLEAVREAARELEQQSGKRDVFFQTEDEAAPAEEKRNLVVTHNLSVKAAEDLLARPKDEALLVNPSLAVSNIEVGAVTDFGDVTLVGPASLADPATGDVSTRNADQWSARYPGDKLKVQIKKDDPGLPSRLDLAITNLTSALDSMDDAIVDAHRSRHLPSSRLMLNRYNLMSAALRTLYRMDDAVRASKDPNRDLSPYTINGRLITNPLVAAALSSDAKIHALVDTPSQILALVESVITYSEDVLPVSRSEEMLSNGSGISRQIMAGVEDGIVQKMLRDHDGKLVPATLGNISAYMQKAGWDEGDLRLGELGGRSASPIPSAGAVRAAVSRQFADINEVAAARNEIVTTEEHEGRAVTFFGSMLTHQASVQNEIASLWRDLKSKHPGKSSELRVVLEPLYYLGQVSPHLVDARFAIAVGDLVSTGKTGEQITAQDVAESLARNWLLPGSESDLITAASERILDTIRLAVNQARELRADYFEAKRTKPTSIYEFGGMALPLHMKGSSIAIAAEKTHLVEYYPMGMGGRLGAVRRLAARLEEGQGKKILFQKSKATFNPKTLTALLYSKADVSSFIHETGHFFLHTLMERAAQANASAADIADAAVLLSWFGVKDIATWRAMSLEEQRRYHEQLAYSFEIYIAEGVAPSLSLGEVFRKLAIWINKVYEGLIKSKLNEKYRAEFGQDLPGLTGEVRDVFGRMFASQEQIDQAKLARGYAATFISRDQFTGTDAEWDAIQAEFQASRDEAVMKLTQAKERNARWGVARQNMLTRAHKQMAAQIRLALRQDVEDELKQKRVYQASAFILNGEPDEDGIVGPHRLDVSFLDERTILGPDGTSLSTDQVKARLGVGRGKMLGVTQSISPDDVAARFGYDDGVQLIQDLLREPSLEEAVEAETQKRFEAQYSELASEKAMQAAIADAMANEVHLRAIASELSVLTKMTEPTRLLIAGAKLAAQEQIDRTPLRQLTWTKIQRAADQAARAALKAQAEGDLDAAILHKREHLLQTVKLRLAMDKLADIEQKNKDVRRAFESDQDLARNRDMGPILAMRLILAAHGEAPKSWTPEKVKDTQKALLDLDPTEYDFLLDLIEESQLKPTKFADMTVGELSVKLDELAGLWKRSKSLRLLEIEGEQLALDDLAKQLIEQALSTRKQKPQAGRREAVTPAEERGALLLSAKAGLRRVESWALSMDGDETPGAFTKFLWRPVKNALTAFRTRRRTLLDKLGVEFSKHDFGKPNQAIDAQEIGYKFANKAELIAALLHTGNAGNFRRLMLGQERPFGKLNADGSIDSTAWQAFLDRAQNAGIITQADWELVRKVWAAHEEIRGDIEKAHYALRGYPMKLVKPWKVKTAWGEIDGGYVPAKTDPRMVLDAQAFEKIDLLEQSPLNTVATTGSGMTKQRSENYAHALSFDLGLVRRNLEEALRYAMVEPTIVAVSKLLRRQDVRAVLGSIDSQVVDKLLVPWLVRSAKQTIGTPGKSKLVDAFWNGARRRASLLLLGGNVVNALQQTTGVIVAAAKVGVRYLASASLRVLFSPRQMAAQIQSLSPYMRETSGKQMLELTERLRDVTLERSKWTRLKDWIEDHKYFAQQFMQDGVNNVVWLAAYDEQMAAGVDQAEAIQRADAAVRLTQGEMVAESVADYETGTPFARSMMQMQSYWSMLAQLNLSAYENSVGRLGFRGAPKLLSTWALTIFAPSAVAVAMTALLRGQRDEDDDDEVLDDLLFSMFVGSPAKATLALVPGGTVTNAAVGLFTKARYDDRMLSTPAVSAIESSLRGAKALATGEVDSRGAARDVMALATMASGVPLNAIDRVVSAAQRAAAIMGSR